MFLVGPVYSHTFFAVSMITTGFLAGTVVLILIFFSELGCKLFLKTKSFCPVSFMKFLHCRQLFRMILNDHSGFLLRFFRNATPWCIPSLRSPGLQIP